MRLITSVLLLLLPAALAAVPSSLAQDSGCTAADPCPWVIHVNATGFVQTDGDEGWVWDEGDVVSIELFVDDDPAHTLTLSDDVSWTGAGYDGDAGPYTEHGTLTLDQWGSFTLTDETTGATTGVRVIGLAETTGPTGDGGDGGHDGGDGMTGGENGSPAPGVLVLGALLAGAALIARRRA